MNLGFGSRLHHPRLLRASAVLTALVLLGACKKHQPSEETAPAASSSAAAPSALAPSVASSAATSAPAEMPDPVIVAPKTEIKLVSAGSGPTNKLAYTFTKGSVKKFSLELMIEPTVSVGGQKMPGGGAIQLKVLGTTKILEVLPNGSAERLSTFQSIEPSGASLPPEAIAQLKTQLNALGALEIKDTVNAQGKVETLTLLHAAAVPPAAQSLVGNISEGMTHALFRFPDAAIGVGAEWTESGSMDSGGIAVSNVLQYKLLKQTGSSVTISLKSKQSAPPGKLPPSPMMPGTTMELVKLLGAGEGTLDVDVKNLSLSAQLKSKLTLAMKGTPPGAPSVVEQSSETKVELKVKITD